MIVYDGGFIFINIGYTGRCIYVGKDEVEIFLVKIYEFLGDN